MRKALSLLLAVSAIVLPILVWGAADDISRLYTFSSGTTIQSSQVNAEFNQLITTMNTKFGRDVANTLTGNNVYSGTSSFTGASTFSGVATFSEGTTPIKTNKIAERTSAAGVTIDGVLLKDSQVSTNTINELTAAAGVTADSVLLKDGMVTVSGTPTTNGQIGYASNALKAYINGAEKTLAVTTDVSTPGLKYLGSVTASASSSMDFTSYITSTYDEYEIRFYNIIPATDTADFHLLTSTNNGSSYDTGAGNYAWAFGNDGSGGTAGNAGSTGDTKIKLKASLGNSTGESASGWIRIYAPLATGSYHTVSWEITGLDSAAAFGRASGGGVRLATTDIDAVRLIMSTGNITSGYAYIYGVAKS